MLTLKTKPDYFQINEWLFTNGAQYRLKNVGDSVGVVRIENESYIIPLTPYNEWVNEIGVAFATLEELLFVLGRAASSDHDHGRAGVEILVNVSLTNPTHGNQLNRLGTLVAPLNYEFVATDDTIITSLNIVMEDGSTFDSAGFGGGPVLTNGVLLYIDGVLAANFKNNMDFVIRATHVSSHEFLSATNRHMLIRRELKPSLEIKKDSVIRAVVQDDLSGLTRFHFGFWGFKV